MVIIGKKVNGRGDEQRIPQAVEDNKVLAKGDQIIQRQVAHPVIAGGGYQLLHNEKQQQIFLQIKNSCAGAPIFENGVPVSKEKGHGIGTRSICAIVERYGGVYTFSLEKEYFVLRLNLSEKNVDSVHFTAV